MRGGILAFLAYARGRKSVTKTKLSENSPSRINELRTPSAIADHVFLIDNNL